MPRLHHAAPFILMALPIAPPTRAALLRDEATGVALDPFVPGATVCFLRPLP